MFVASYLAIQHHQAAGRYRLRKAQVNRVQVLGGAFDPEAGPVREQQVQGVVLRAFPCSELDKAPVGNADPPEYLLKDAASSF